MGRFVRPALTLLLALFMRPGPGPGSASDSISTAPGPAPPVATPWAATSSDPVWYEPLAEDFRPAFARGGGGRLAWDRYWGWVRSFYAGNRLARGWNDRARWLIAEVRSEAERGRLRARLNALGRAIGAEWARDYDVRRVSSADLLAWGRMMEKARARDGGDGVEIHRALGAIAGQLRRKAGSGPSLRDVAAREPIPDQSNRPRPEPTRP